MSKAYRPLTSLEESLNVWTHLIGLLLTVVGSFFLLGKVMSVYSGDWMGGPLIFLISLAAVFLSSTLYHASSTDAMKRRLRVVDHIGIFLLIAGTTTPFASRYLVAPLDTMFLIMMWGIGVIGIGFKLFAFKRFDRYSVLYYVIMGALGVGFILAKVSDMALIVRYYILAGAISYLVGVWFYRNKKMMYSHTIWHLFVMVGSWFHYLAIYYSLDGL